MPLSFSTSLTDNWSPESIVVYSPGTHASLQEAIDAAELLPQAYENGGFAVAVILPPGFIDESVVIHKRIFLIGQGTKVTKVTGVTFRPDADFVTRGGLVSLHVSNLFASTETAESSGVYQQNFLQEHLYLENIYCNETLSIEHVGTIYMKGCQFDADVNIKNCYYADFIHCWMNFLNFSGEENIDAGWVETYQSAVYLDGSLCFDSVSVTCDGLVVAHLGLYNSYVNNLTSNDGTSLFVTGGQIRSRTVNGSVDIQGYNSNSPFKPTNPGDWTTTPTGVDSALDELAARSAAAGEANTASNVGAAGEGIFKQKAGVDLEFKKLKGGTGITVAASGASEIEISSSITQYTDGDARSAVVIDSIADSDTTHAPSRNSVFNALAGKAASSHSHTSADVSDFASAAKSAVVSDTAYNESSWNAVTDVAPSKNVVRDELEARFNTSTGHDHDGTDAKKIPVGSMDATGTPSSTTYLRGDGSWSTPSGGSAKAAMVAGWETIRTFSNIGTSYVNILNLQLNGGRQPVDFSNYTEFRVIAHYNHIGAGTQNIRVVDQTDNSNVLVELSGTTGAAEKEVESAWTAIPGWVSGEEYLVPQMKSTTAGDDPVFRDITIWLR